MNPRLVAIGLTAFGLVLGVVGVAAQAPAAVEPLGQAGGATIAVRAAAGRAYVGVGPRLEILDTADPGAPTLIGRGPALGEVVQDVAVDGTRAYVAEGALDERGFSYPAASPGGLRVLDLSDPARPAPVGFAAAATAPRGIAVAAGRAYVAAGEGGLLIYDLADPARPRQLGTYKASGSVTYDVVVAGRYAYLADGNALDVVDVSDPAAPTTAARFTIPALTGWPDLHSTARGLTLIGSRVYLAETAVNVGMADFQGGGVRIVDVSDPSNPRQLGNYQGGPGGLHGRRIEVAGTLAYVSTSVTERYGGGGRLELFDVADPANPRLLTTHFDLPPTTNTANGIALVGSRVYLGVGSGLTVYDATNPANPRVTAKRGTPMNAGRMVVAGRYAYVSAGRGGMSVLDVADPSAPAVVGHYDAGGTVVDLGAAGSRVYLALQSVQTPPLLILDASDPARPTLVGSATPGVVRGLAAAGTTLYVLTSGDLRIYDASDPANLRQLGALAVGGTNLRVSGDRAYVSTFESFTSPLHVIDVSDPTRPTTLNRTQIYDAYDLAIDSGRVYVAERNSATTGSDLRVLTGCAGSPDKLNTTGTLDTVGQAQGVAARGGLVYVADEAAGLLVVDAADPLHPTRLATWSRTPGRAVAVAGQLAYLGAGPEGLWIGRVNATAAEPSSLVCRWFVPVVPQRSGV